LLFPSGSGSHSAYHRHGATVLTHAGTHHGDDLDERDGPGHRERQQRNDDVYPDGHERRRGQVVHAHQVKAREEAAGDATSDVAAIEETEPGHAFGRRFHPA